MLTNKEQLYQSFWQSVKEQKFKTKKIEGLHPPPPSSLEGLKREQIKLVKAGKNKPVFLQIKAG